MFERTTRFAERAATSVSRRQFLGRVGRGAMTLAAAAGGLLALAGTAQAALKVCGAGSAIYCQGLPAGAGCQIGTIAGTCVGAPDCTCVPSRGPRGGRR
jgi:hypothetical protein